MRLLIAIFLYGLQEFYIEIKWKDKVLVSLFGENSSMSFYGMKPPKIEIMADSIVSSLYGIINYLVILFFNSLARIIVKYENHR